MGGFNGSEWITVPVVGVRLVSAMDRALVTSEEAWWVSIDQPATLLEWASCTTQQETPPSRVRCSLPSFPVSTTTRPLH